RFIRHYAKDFAIDPSRIGGLGYSSGAHLVSLLGTLGGEGQADSTDPIEQESAKLQCIVAGGTATDLTDLSAPFLAPSIASFLGVLTTFSPPQSQEYNTALQASPVHHASPGDAPHLLFHSEKDEIIPLAHARKLADKLRDADVPVKLLVIPNGTHMNLHTPDAPDYISDMVAWFNRYLRGE
ncbi:MAG: prolyl oligopeptidase family serine peptidase, partial [Dehalococcoidia bacterium]